jgi:nanoRNase/pAp phosphatase (c-di-AMP/oligoRNAs hydrolase)
MKNDEKTLLRVKKLSDMLRDCSTMLIIMQDNPDPDSIAAAVALRTLANSLGSIQCSIAHGGTVGRAENRALVSYLGLNLRSMEQLDIHRFDLIAMVDTQPGTGNNSLDNAITPDIVIDHHSYRKATRLCTFTDIRKSYGATATILLEYMIACKLLPDVPVATALLYGIRSDTQDLGREASKPDLQAIALLFTIANKRMLSEIQRGRVHRQYFKMLADGLQNAKVQGKAIVTSLGEIENPDMIAEVADLLLRDDETLWTLCYGFSQNKALFSIRTSEPNGKASKVAHYISARRGTAGGHQSYAGGQIPLKKQTKKERTEIEKLIPAKFLKKLALDNESSSKLV